MEIEMIVDFAGAPVEVKVFAEENFLGTIYLVELNDNYSFTLFFKDEDEWVVLREPDGTTPVVENELFNKILKNLEQQLRYAA